MFSKQSELVKWSLTCMWPRVSCTGNWMQVVTVINTFNRFCLHINCIFNFFKFHGMKTWNMHSKAQQWIIKEKYKTYQSESPLCLRILFLFEIWGPNNYQENNVRIINLTAVFIFSEKTTAIINGVKIPQDFLAELINRFNGTIGFSHKRNEWPY